MTVDDETVREVSTAVVTTRRNASNKISLLWFCKLGVERKSHCYGVQKKEKKDVFNFIILIFCSWGVFFSPSCGTGGGAMECEGKGQIGAWMEVHLHHWGKLMAKAIFFTHIYVCFFSSPPTDGSFLVILV